MSDQSLRHQKELSGRSAHIFDIQTYSEWPAKRVQHPSLLESCRNTSFCSRRFSKKARTSKNILHIPKSFTTQGIFCTPRKLFSAKAEREAISIARAAWPDTGRPPVQGDWPLQLRSTCVCASSVGATGPGGPNAARRSKKVRK